MMEIKHLKLIKSLKTKSLMKKIYLLSVLFLSTFASFAQTPQKMSYQAIIRNSSDMVVANQSIGIQISIIQTNPAGAAVYVETQTPTTNANGLLSIEIGTGSVVSGDFTTIDWSSDTYFIKTEVDTAGGTNYTITGTSQLMSVPYALHAKTAEKLTEVSRISIQGFDDDLVDFGGIGSLSGASSNTTDATTLGSLLQIGTATTTYNNGGSDITLTSNQFNIANAGTYEIFVSFSANNFGTGSNNILQLAKNGATIAVSVSSADDSSNGNPATMVIKYIGAFVASDTIGLYYKNDASSGWRGKAISVDIQKID